MRVRQLLACMALAAVCAATGATSGGASAELGVKTLAVVPGEVLAFAQDGPRLAWGGSAGVAVLDLRSGRRISLGAMCTRRPTEAHDPSVEAIAIGGSRVLWEGATTYGNTSVDRCVATASTAHRRATRLGVDGAYFEGEIDIPPALAAGDGATLVYHWACGGECGNGKNEVRRAPAKTRVFTVGVPPALSAGLEAAPQELFPRAFGLAAAGGDIAVLEDLHPCACNEAPQWSPDGGHIAWSRDGVVYAMNADGSEKRRISPAAVGYADAPRWSPDGRRLAFELRPNGQRESWDVHVVDADGSGQRLLTDGRKPWWSPDAQQLSFIQGGNLWTIGADGGGARRLTTGGGAFGGEWSPDGTGLVFARDTGLYLARVDGSGETRLVAASVDARTGDPRWSPDGGRIVFVAGRNLTLQTVDAAGSSRRQLADEASSPAWSPDGGRLAFEKNDESGEFDRLFVVSAAGGEARAITSKTISAHFPAWSPDGSTLVAVGDPPWIGGTDGLIGRRVAGVYRVGADGSGLTKLAPDDRAAVDIRDARTGARRASLLVSRDAHAVALSRSYVAVLGPTVDVYERRGGTLVASTPAQASRNCEATWGCYIGVSDSGVAVFAIGRQIRAFDAQTRVLRTVTTVRAAPIGLSLEGTRVAWAENRGSKALIMAITLPARLR